MNIIQKLKSRAGSSLLLALVFLLFCLFVGGSVLAAAAANAGRAAKLQQDSQRELSGRSAMQIMAGQLKSAPESQLQLTIQDVKVFQADGSAARRVTYCIHGEEGYPKSAFQKLLYTFAVHQYEADRGAPGMRVFRNFDFGDIPNSEYRMELWSQMQYVFPIEGSLQMDSGGTLEHWRAECTLTEEYAVRIDFPEGPRMYLTMEAYFDTGPTITTWLDGIKTETTTTVIRWEDPVICKGGTEDA